MSSMSGDHGDWTASACRNGPSERRLGLVAQGVAPVARAFDLRLLLEVVGGSLRAQGCPETVYQHADGLAAQPTLGQLGPG